VKPWIEKLLSDPVVVNDLKATYEEFVNFSAERSPDFCYGEPWTGDAWIQRHAFELLISLSYDGVAPIRFTRTGHTVGVITIKLLNLSADLRNRVPFVIGLISFEKEASDNLNEFLCGLIDELASAFPCVIRIQGSDVNVNVRLHSVVADGKAMRQMASYKTVTSNFSCMYCTLNAVNLPNVGRTWKFFAVPADELRTHVSICDDFDRVNRSEAVDAQSIVAGRSVLRRSSLRFDGDMLIDLMHQLYLNICPKVFQLVFDGVPMEFLVAYMGQVADLIGSDLSRGIVNLVQFRSLAAILRLRLLIIRLF
jgi:hypothetical protein